MGWPLGNWPKRRGVLLNLQAAVRPQFSSKMIARVRSELDVSTGTCHTVITSRRIGGERFLCVRCQNAADRAVPSRLVDSSIILPIECEDGRRAMDVCSTPPSARISHRQNRMCR